MNNKSGSERGEDEGPYKAVKQTCRMCGNTHVSVHPVDMVRDGECPNCHHFTCEDEE